MRAYVRLFVCQIEQELSVEWLDRYLSDVLNVKGKRARWREGRGSGLSEEMDDI